MNAGGAPRRVFTASAFQDGITAEWLVKVSMESPGAWAVSPAEARAWAEALVRAADNADQPGAREDASPTALGPDL